jgi:deoxyhypusine synthase
MAHGFVEAMGGTHFKHDPSMDDSALYQAGYNRVYDSLELEQNLEDTLALVTRAMQDWPDDQPLTSRAVHQELGRVLDAEKLEPGILVSAFRKGVPVYVPAFTDSELCLDLCTVSRRRQAQGRAALRVEPLLDLEDITARYLAAKRLGIFTIGGGVPRNWAQQITCYIEGLINRIGLQADIKRFTYGVRLCPEPAHWGGLSGCTYTEGVSWGKFTPPDQGGRFAEVLCDATIAWPILQMAVEERLRTDPPAHLKP